MAMNMGINGVNNWVTEICGIEKTSAWQFNITAEDADICNRWMELAAFLPMVRIKGSFSENLVSTNAAYGNFTDFTRAMHQRLPFTRYIYSQMFSANYTGGSVVYPLYFDFPTDKQALDNIEQTFMLGDSVKVSPILDSNPDSSATFSSYFPAGVWRDLNDFTVSVKSTGSYFKLPRTPGKTQHHLKAGKVLPL